MVDVGTDPTVAELGIFCRLIGLAQRVPTAQKPVPVGSSSTNDLVSLCMDFTHTTNAGELTLALLIGLVSIAPMFWKILPHRGRYIAVWAVIYPLIVWWLMYGGFFLVWSGLKPGNGAG